MTSRIPIRHPEGSQTTLMGHRMLATLLSIVILAVGNDVTAFNDVNSVSSTAGENESWNNDLCVQHREIAEACSACSRELPSLGVTTWQCCHDSDVRKECAQAAASLLTIDESSDDDIVENVDEKRAKYFLGKRAKYFLGKRMFGERGMRYHRPGQRHEAMAEGFSLFGNERQSQSAPDKRAKYFLG